MSTEFTKLNADWNAEPNAPNPQVQVWEHDLVLSFLLNPFVDRQFKEENEERAQPVAKANGPNQSRPILNVSPINL